MRTFTRLFVSACLCAVIISYAGGAAVHAARPSLQFSPATYTVRPQSTMKVDIMLDTDGVAVGGTGAKLTFDPQYLAIDEVIPGKLFTDYPLASYSNEKGTASVAGIVTDKKKLYKGKDLFAMVIFRAIKEGKTEVKFVYQPGSTRDSNIAVLYGSGDALAQVNQLEVTISTSAPENSLNTKQIEKNRFISQAPIKTDPNQQQQKVEGQVLSENTQVDTAAITPQQATNYRKILGFSMSAAGVLLFLGMLALLV